MSFSLMDGDLQINGFIKNLTGVRLKDRVWYDQIYAEMMNRLVPNAEQEEGNLSRCITTLQLESEWNISRDLRLNATWRAF